jgi:hypothetical protein
MTQQGPRGPIPQSVAPNLLGTPWGAVFPPTSDIPFPAIDGRTAALHVLRDYITNLTFWRYAGPSTPPKPFQIDPRNVHIEWPDHETDLVFPSIAVVHSRADYDVIGLVSYIEEETQDLYAPNTVLQWQAEYVETINLEIWVSKKSERRALLAGLETAFSPTEQASGLRFKMPEYYNELVVFTLMRREVMDEPDAARNRRRAQLEMEMRFNIVRLVNVVDAQPVIKVNTDVDVDTMQPTLPIILGDPNARMGPDLQVQFNFDKSMQPPGTEPNPAFK